MSDLTERGLSITEIEENNKALTKFSPHKGGIILHLLHLTPSRILSRFNIREIVAELKRLDKKHGLYFLAYAICIEVFEDVVLPYVLYFLGKSHLIPVALAFHCEPIAYLCTLLSCQR